MGSITNTVLTYREFQHQNRYASMERIHSKGQALFVDVGRILVVEHVIERRDLPVRIGDLWKGGVREVQQDNQRNIQWGTGGQFCPTR